MISLRTVERAVAPLRQKLRAQARAAVRFETPPGRQLKIGFGELKVPIGAKVFRHERQSALVRWDRGAARGLRWRVAGSAADNARTQVEHQGLGRVPGGTRGRDFCEEPAMRRSRGVADRSRTHHLICMQQTQNDRQQLSIDLDTDAYAERSSISGVPTFSGSANSANGLSSPLSGRLSSLSIHVRNQSSSMINAHSRVPCSCRPV